MFWWLLKYKAVSRGYYTQHRHKMHFLSTDQKTIPSTNKGINFTFIELKRRGKEVYYWKNKHECDFLVKEGEEIKEAIQVCYDLTGENRDREIDGITEAMEEFRLGEGLVITGDLEGGAEISCGTVSYKPLWKWLLD